MMDWKALKDRLQSFLQDVEEINRGNLADLHEWEETELRNIFALLVVGNFVGLPAPPAHITSALLPEMEQEIHIMLERINPAHDPLAELVSLMDIG